MTTHTIHIMRIHRQLEPLKRKEKHMTAAMFPQDNSVDEALKRDFEQTAANIGPTSTEALAIFMECFVSEEGFPFDAERCAPKKERLFKEMAEKCRKDGAFAPKR